MEEDPLFTEPITLAELEAELKSCPPDKSPGPDGVTNRMLKASGPLLRQCLLLTSDTIWQLNCQPSDWQQSLIQPIFKGGKKDPASPASFRGIYLTSALAKLFEGLLVTRLTTYTETHNTLTDNQFGSRPGRQIHP
jgi:hypothetical protein